MSKRRTKTYFIVDEIINERVVWSSELDELYLCYVTKISEDLYCLNAEDKYAAEFVVRRFFTHQGKLTAEMIEQWQDEIATVIDNRYADPASYME